MYYYFGYEVDLLQIKKLPVLKILFKCCIPYTFSTIVIHK